MTKEALSAATVSVPIVNEVTSNGVINALQLEDWAILGMTYGAWFKLGMGVALALLITERALSIWQKTK